MVLLSVADDRSALLLESCKTMSDDIVKRLLEHTEGNDVVTHELCLDAAGEIINLTALCREAQEFMNHDKNCGAVMGRFNDCDCGYDELWRKLNV